MKLLAVLVVVLAVDCISASPLLGGSGGLLESLGVGLSTAVNDVATSRGDPWTPASRQLTELGNLLPIFAPILKIVIDIIPIFSDAVIGLLTRLAKLIPSLAPFVKKLIGSIPKILNAIIKDFPNTLASIGDFVKGIFALVVSVAAPLIKAALNFITKTISQTGLNTLVSGVQKLLQDLIAAIDV